ncbi:MAG: tRNA-dihydrouridine synthase, partial [Halanaerobiaceae bacterium]
KSVSIPVIGNGDIFTPQDAGKMMSFTDCDGVMLARGIQGNPWLVKRAICYLRSGEILPEPACKEKIKMALYHLKKSINYFGEEIAVPRMRKHLTWYLKGMPYSGKIREDLNQLSKYTEIKQLFDEYMETTLS